MKFFFDHRSSSSSSSCSNFTPLNPLQSLNNTLRDGDDQRSAVASYFNDMRHRIGEIDRRLEGNDRKSDMHIDQLHNLKNQLDLQVSSLDSTKNTESDHRESDSAWRSELKLIFLRSNFLKGSVPSCVSRVGRVEPTFLFRNQDTSGM